MKTYKITLVVLFSIFAMMPSFAEKIPVKISPIQIVSTNNDEVELGDSVPFIVVNDVYVKDKLYIKEGTQINGTIGFVHQNGWGADCAQIVFNNFYTKDVGNNLVEIPYQLTIDGQREASNAARESIAGTRNVVYIALSQVTSDAYFIARYFPFLFRGSEIFIEPDERIFNIFIER